jgi:hypothetical protein
MKKWILLAGVLTLSFAANAQQVCSDNVSSGDIVEIGCLVSVQEINQASKEKQKEEKAQLDLLKNRHDVYFRLGFGKATTDKEFNYHWQGNDIHSSLSADISEQFSIGYSYNFDSRLIVGAGLEFMQYEHKRISNFSTKNKGRHDGNIFLLGGYKINDSFISYIKIGALAMGVGFDYIMLSWLKLFAEYNQVSQNGGVDVMGYKEEIGGKAGMLNFGVKIILF